MSIHFLGNCEWIQIHDPEWTVGSYGMDQCQISWQGRRDKKAAFENSIRKFSALSGYPTMGLEGWSTSGGTMNMPIITLSYVGFRDGRIPKARPESGISVQSAQGSGSYTSGDEVRQVSGTILYRASRTSWTWFETSRPSATPRFATVEYPTNPLDPKNIIFYSVTDADGQRLHNVPYSAFVTVMNSLVRQTVVSDYTITPIIDGSLWAASCTVDDKLAS